MAAKRESVPIYKELEWEGEKYKIASVSQGVILSEKEKINIAELVCKMYATGRYSVQNILDFVGIGKNAWMCWVNEVKQIGQLYYEAQEKKDVIFRSDLKERARTQVEKWVNGYTMELTEKEAEPVQVDDGKGNITTELRTVKIRKKEVFISPPVKLLEMILYNMDGKNFKKFPDEFKGGNEDKMPTEIKIEIIGGGVPAVTDEDKIKEI